MEAWLVDALAATGYHGLLDRVFARGQQVTGAAMLVGTVGGGLLGQISLSVPYVVRAVLLLAVFAVAYVVMHDLGFEPRTHRRPRPSRRDREQCEGGCRVRLAAARPPAPDPRLDDPDGVLRVGVLRRRSRTSSDSSTRTRPGSQDSSQPGSRSRRSRETRSSRSRRATAVAARRSCSPAAAVETVGCGGRWGSPRRSGWRCRRFSS